MKNMHYAALLLCGTVGLFQSANSTEPERTAFEQSFIGRKWIRTSADYDQYPLSNGCRYTGGQLLQKNQSLSLNSFICADGRTLNLITQKLPPAHGMISAPTLVLDAFLFPKPKEGEALMSTGNCSLYGDTDIDFTALVRLGEYELVDWHTGVIAAWIPNVQTQKYEPLSTRHIVCGAPTPP